MTKNSNINCGKFTTKTEIFPEIKVLNFQERKLGRHISRESFVNKTKNVYSSLVFDG